MTRHVHVEHVMGTAVSFDVRGEDDPRAAIAAACAWLHEVDRTFSTHRRESTVSRLGRGELDPAALDRTVAAVLARCRRLESLTAGAFDLYASGRLDPSGYVKGWAVQRASDLLADAGHPVHTVNGGGDIAARGEPSPGGWRIGIVDPHDRTAYVHIAALRDAAIATSARSERGDHVPARHAGEPIDSVSVVAGHLGRADAWATAILAGGWATLRRAAAQPGLELLVVSGSRVLRSPAFPAVPARREAASCGSHLHRADSAHAGPDRRGRGQDGRPHPARPA